MGSRIAAHLANAGIPVRLLDVVVPGQADRSWAAKRGIETALEVRPGGFFIASSKSLITPGNFDDDLPAIGDCDWVIEAVAEKLEVKRSLWERVDKVRKPDALLSTNTSGIPLRRIAEGFPDDFRKRFLGTHFFNPPRYLHLVEIIPGPATDRKLLRWLSDFCEARLGKGAVECKDTPNFIANRIGSFYGSTVYKLTVEGNYTIEEVDALTGPLIGVPKSASYRLLDVVGLDVWAYVARNLYEMVPDDPWRERFLPPPFAEEMMKRNWLGEKMRQGFYKRVGPQKEIWAIDWKTLEYHVAARPRVPGVDEIRQIESLPERLRALAADKGRAGEFLWPLFRDVLLYSAERIPEIANRVVEVDRAMRWGYGHTYGPFELWDALGFTTVCDRIEREGGSLPENIVRMREKGANSFYRAGDHDGISQTEYFDLRNTHYDLLEQRPGVYVLSELKRARGVVKSNAGASLIDLGDGVLCCEFHSKMNALGDDAEQMVLAGLEETERNFAAMVIANQGENFSAGANLLLLLLSAQEGDWEEIDLAVRRFQSMNMALKFAARPVVAAPFSRVLGGGAEVVLHCSRAQASAETYMGLVEVGVGLIPAGGGCKEMMARLGNPQRVFELIGMAKVSGSAAEAQQIGLLHKADRITMNPERLVGDAKALALSMVSTWSPGVPRPDIPVGGNAAFAAMKLAAWSMHQGGFISDYDYHIAQKLAHVLSGGRSAGGGLASEQQLLDLEREAFLSLCGEQKTQERIAWMLKNGTALRN
jgi:3-hydroxyacyl-CoA dehydrogenase